MDTAIRPTFNIPEFIKEKPITDEVTLTDEEKVLGAGANNIFWRTLKKHIESEIELLDQIAESAIESGAPLEEIGRNTIVVSQVKGVLRRIYNIVEDAKEATENAK